MKKQKAGKRGVFKELFGVIKEGKIAFAVFCLLWGSTLAVLLQGAASGRWERVFTGALCLVLFLLPPLVEHRFSLRFPAALEISAYLFVFCAGVLGEIGDFYLRFAAWDSILHAANGFWFAGFGFCLFSLFENKRTVRTLPSPAYQSFTAFCFSMTVGALWEIFEFAADLFCTQTCKRIAFAQRSTACFCQVRRGWRVLKISNG